MTNWHIWTINQQRFKKIKEFLDKLSGIDSYLYPTAVKEYSTKTGWKTTDVPIYGNYIFIKYNYTNSVHSTIENYRWIKDYIGICSREEIDRVKELTNQKYEDIMPTDDIVVGKSYKLINTPFKEMICTVVKINGDKLVVSVRLFGSDRLIKCLASDINAEG